MSRLLLTEEKAYQHLKDLYEQQGKKLNMRELFAQDADRFSKYSHLLTTPDGEILFDFSKNLINQEILDALLQLVFFISILFGKFKSSLFINNVSKLKIKILSVFSNSLLENLIEFEFIKIWCMFLKNYNLTRNKIL